MTNNQLKYSFVDDPESIGFVLNRLSDNRNLNDWEKSFIKNIKDYYDRGGFLSAKQKDKLSDLWEKY